MINAAATERRPTVYVPQEPMRWDPALGARVPMYDLSGAAKFGRIHICIPPTIVLHDTAEIARRLAAGMETFDEGDFLLAVGSPMMIAIAGHIALSNAGGAIQMLNWDRRSGAYVSLKVMVK